MPEPLADTSPTELFTLEDYATAARVVALYLEEFCDPRLLYPAMMAESARRAAMEIQRLRAVIEQRQGEGEEP